MTYQEYLRLTTKLTEQKDSLYNIASHKISKGDNDGARRIYKEIDEVQKELNELVDPNDGLLGPNDGLLKFELA
jgi:hypothetical protein